MQGGDAAAFGVQGFVVVSVPRDSTYTLHAEFKPTYPGVQTTELVGTLDNGATFRVRLRGRGIDTAIARPRRIVGDTVSARVGERVMMHFDVQPPFAANDGVTTAYVRMRIDPLALFAHRVIVEQSVRATHTFRADGTLEVRISSDQPMQLGGFDVELEGLFTGHAINRVVIDSVELDNPQIGVSASPGRVNLDGCDIERGDSLARVVRIEGVAPNPVRDVAVLRFAASAGALVRVVGIDGRILIERMVGAGDDGAVREMLLDQLPPGVCIVELRHGTESDRILLQVAR
jgi:hypothetical protein